jgi:hypothetical protein
MNLVYCIDCICLFWCKIKWKPDAIGFVWIVSHELNYNNNFLFSVCFLIVLVHFIDVFHYSWHQQTIMSNYWKMILKTFWYCEQFNDKCKCVCAYILMLFLLSFPFIYKNIYFSSALKYRSALSNCNLLLCIKFW